MVKRTPFHSEPVQPKNYCTARVPDNSDFVTCGGKILRADRCAECLGVEVREIRAELSVKKREVKMLEDRLAELETESG